MSRRTFAFAHVRPGKVSNPTQYSLHAEDQSSIGPIETSFDQLTRHAKVAAQLSIHSLLISENVPLSFVQRLQAWVEDRDGLERSLAPTGVSTHRTSLGIILCFKTFPCE